MNVVAFILILVSGAFGAVEIVQSQGKSLTGWALVALSAGLLVQFCTTWSHTIHF